MATKATTTVRRLDLSVARVREVVASERFLLTVDDAEESGAGGQESQGKSLNIIEGSREISEDGAVSAVVTAAGGEDGAEFTVEQKSEVSVPDSDGSFTVFTTVPLPGDIGTMATNQIYRPEGTDTVLESTVAVEVRIPLVGGKIATKILEGVESSTDQGVKRILELARR